MMGLQIILCGSLLLLLQGGTLTPSGGSAEASYPDRSEASKTAGSILMRTAVEILRDANVANTQEHRDMVFEMLLDSYRKGDNYRASLKTLRFGRRR